MGSATRFLLATVFLVAALAPSAAAAPSCSSVTVASLQAGGYHVRTSPREIWQETNSVAGLQTGPCVHGGKSVPSDRFVSYVPPQLLGLCFGIGVFVCV